MGSKKGWGETKQRVIWQKDLDGRDSIVRQATGLDRSRLFHQNIFILVISRIPMFWHLAAERASLSSSSSSTFQPFSVFYDICSFRVCILYSNLLCSTIRGPFYYYYYLCVCEREPQTTKQNIPTYLPDLHNILYYHLFHLFSSSLTFSTRPCMPLPSPSPKTRVHLEFEEKKNHAQHQNHRAPSRQHNSKMHNRTTRSGNASARSGCRGRLHLWSRSVGRENRFRNHFHQRGTGTDGQSSSSSLWPAAAAAAFGYQASMNIWCNNRVWDP